MLRWNVSYFSIRHLCSLWICRPDSPYLASVVSASSKNSYTPLVRCTNHMCPIRVHWHVKLNYKEYWRVKVTVTNFNYGMNYSDWNLVVQHPNFDNLTQSFSFNYKSITPYATISMLILTYYFFICSLIIVLLCDLTCTSSFPRFLKDLHMLIFIIMHAHWKLGMCNLVFFQTDDTAMLWGLKFYNDLLMQAGPLGNVQSELLFRKDQATFTFDKGWAFPRRIYFNGDNCVMPPPDAYPWLPNSGFRQYTSLLTLIMTSLSTAALMYVHA